MELDDNIEKDENMIINQRNKIGELEIISEEKNGGCSGENTNNKFNKKSNLSSKKNTDHKKDLKYSPKLLFDNKRNILEENNENDTYELMNYLSDDNEKNTNLKEDEKVKKNINNTIINELSKSYNDINIIKLAKEETDNNNRLPQPLSNRLNLSMVSNEPIEKDKIKESSSKKGALKILELIASKKKEKEEIDKKKEELMIETFQKATNNNEKISIKYPGKNETNNPIDNINLNIISDNKYKKEEDNIDKNEIKFLDEKINKEENLINKNEDIINNDKSQETEGIDNKTDYTKKEKESINETNDLTILSGKSSPKILNENLNFLNQKIPTNNESKLYVKNARKFLKKPTNIINSNNILTKNSFSISRGMKNIDDNEKISEITKLEKQNKDKEVMKYKNSKRQPNITDDYNKSRKDPKKTIFDGNRNNKDSFDSVTVYKKHPVSKSPKGRIFEPKKALNQRGSSMNKYNNNLILGKSNININNVNYINNINTIIKNRDNCDNNFNEDNIAKLNNSFNINMKNNNYNNFTNDYKCIDNYSKYNKNDFDYNLLRNYNSNFINNNQSFKKMLIDKQNNNNLLKMNNILVNDNEEAEDSKENINIKYKKNIFKTKSNKNFMLNKYTPDKNISNIDNNYQNNLSSNSQRFLKNQRIIPSIYPNKYNKNNKQSQRYYIYNNKDNININNNAKYNISQNYFDINNNIITTDGSNTNNNFDNFMIDHDRNNLSNANKNSSISINIEDLMVFEEKFSEIIYFVKNGKEARNQCFDFWNYFFNCSLYERIEKIFKTDKNIEIAKLSINLELITVMICYEFSFDIGVLNKSNLLLLEILELSHRNLIIICENILMKIIPENQKNIWALKLNNLVNNSKKFISNNISNLSHIEQIIMNSTKLSQKLQNIFSIFGTEYSPLIYSLYKKIHQKSYSEINDFFIEYILKIENKESSILAPVLLSSNPNFISFRPPYIHTERIKPYTLILDLNDTIVNFQQTNNSQGILRLRPFLIEFLEEISHYYELILFTTSTEYFSKPIINAIEENKKYFDFVFYREYAIIVGNDFVKDLTRIGRSLDSTIIIDNMPQNFRLQKENGIHIKPFFAQDPNDNTLIELMNILIIIAKSGVDVREELAKYRNDIVQKVTSNISKYNN